MRHKIVSISMLWLTMIVSIVWFVDSIWVRSVLVLIAIGVTIHLSMVKTMKNYSTVPAEGLNQTNLPDDQVQVQEEKK